MGPTGRARLCARASMRVSKAHSHSQVFYAPQNLDQALGRSLHDKRVPLSLIEHCL